jgi:hypothetical protein
MNQKELHTVIQDGEGQRIEFKESFAEENEAIESLCAFANADSGRVFFGIKNDRTIIGVTIGKNTIENFINKLRRETNPPLSPICEQISHPKGTVVIFEASKGGKGQLFYAFGKPFIRVGKTNQVMSPDEQRTRLLADDYWSAEKNRPTFEVIGGSLKCLEKQFEPSWKIKQVAGDYVSNIEWRFRGPRFRMEWKQTTGYALERTNISGTFDLTAEPKEDDVVKIDELAVEICFHWHGSRWHELHRWPIKRTEFPTKVHCDVGREILPPLSWKDAGQ